MSPLKTTVPGSLVRHSGTRTSLDKFIKRDRDVDKSVTSSDKMIAKFVCVAAFITLANSYSINRIESETHTLNRVDDGIDGSDVTLPAESTPSAPTEVTTMTIASSDLPSTMTEGSTAAPDQASVASVASSVTEATTAAEVVEQSTPEATTEVTAATVTDIATESTTPVTVSEMPTTTTRAPTPSPFEFVGVPQGGGLPAVGLPNLVLRSLQDTLNQIGMLVRVLGETSQQVTHVVQTSSRLIAGK